MENVKESEWAKKNQWNYKGKTGRDKDNIIGEKEINEVDIFNQW